MNCTTGIPLMRRAQNLLLLVANTCFKLWTEDLHGTPSEETAYGHWMELRRCAEVIEKKGDLGEGDIRSVQLAERWLMERGYHDDTLCRLGQLIGQMQEAA